MMRKKFQEKACMAAAVVGALLVGVLLFYKHWQFELPLYPNVDEMLSLENIYDLLDQHLYTGDIYVLDFFRYPHLTFYYGAVGARILGKLLAGVDTVVLLRYVICGTALLSNVCVYFAVKVMTGSRKWGYIGFLLSVFSLYGYAYLYYTGPDTLLYAVANVLLLLGCVIYQDRDEERVVYLWYPLMAICIGLAMAAKYHGIVFGIFWLALHIRKKYWKSHRNNYLFFMDCIVLALVFCLCNYSLFFHFKTFIGDNLYNLNHYAWGHPGIEHNLPLLGYLEAFGFTNYGAVGGILLLMGIVCLIRKKDWAQMTVFLLMPVCILLLLSKYQIVLGRNMSLVLPFAFLFMTYGLMEVERILSIYFLRQREIQKADQKEQELKKTKDNREDRKGKRSITAAGIVIGAVVLMIICNAAVVCNSYRYGLTYTQASADIGNLIPEGSKIYCTSYAPMMDTNRYEIVEIGEDISLLPDRLGAGEYYIDVQYATGYFTQRKDYLICQGKEMYPDKKAAYEGKLGGYEVMKNYQGISYGGEWKYRIGYLDIFRYAPGEYYVGPSVVIYAGR